MIGSVRKSAIGIQNILVSSKTVEHFQIGLKAVKPEWLPGDYIENLTKYFKFRSQLDKVTI